jgi:multiple sugar transport system substrate-binding protein
VPCTLDLDAGRAAGAALIAGTPRPDVVVCANDEVALGVLTAAADAGLAVPDDLAITGWDGLMAARFAGLTTVEQPCGSWAPPRLACFTTASPNGPRAPPPAGVCAARSSPRGWSFAPAAANTPGGSDMMMYRRLAAVATVTVTALALTACGRDSGGGPDDARPIDEGKATGEITVWAMGTEGEKLEAFAQDFTKENPNAKVTVTAIPWYAAHQRIASAIACRQTPDVSMIFTTWMGEFAKTGALDPTPPGLIDSSAFFEGAWNTTVVDGTSYGVPWYVETRLIYYRKDLAQQAGVTAPASWDELKDFARAMKEKAGAQWGISLQPGGTGSWVTFLPFAWSNGAEIVSGGQFTLDSPEMVEALGYYQSFFTDGLSPFDLAPKALETGFIDGSIGAFISGPWHGGILAEQGGAAFTDKWAVAPMPRKKSATSFVGGSDLAVFNDAKNRGGAWSFVAWLSRPDVQVKWYQTVKGLPAVKKAWEDSTLSGDPFLKTFGEQLHAAKSPPAIATWEQVAAAIDGEVEKVRKAGTSPAEALKAAQEKAAVIGTGA